MTDPGPQAICSQFEPLKKKKSRAATLAAEAEDCDEWEDDPEDDEDDELYEQAAEEKIEKERGELEEIFRDPDLERLWQVSPRAKVPEPTVEEVKDGLSAMQKVRLTLTANVHRTNCVLADQDWPSLRTQRSDAESPRSALPPSETTPTAASQDGQAGSNSLEHHERRHQPSYSSQALPQRPLRITRLERRPSPDATPQTFLHN